MAIKFKKVLKMVLWLMLISFVVFVLLVIIVGWAISTPAYKGEVSANFNGTTFVNEEFYKRPVSSGLKWFLTNERGEWPDKVEVKTTIPDKRIEGDRLVATFVGHSTVLIQTGGLNILTDPIWSNRAGPFSWAGVKRVTPPGVHIEDLPQIDIVLVSHNHYDHMDLPTLKQLQAAHSPKLITTLGNMKFLNSKGINAIAEMDWWDSLESMGARITCVPLQHFSGRGLFDRNKTLWGGFVVEIGNKKVFFGADTGYSRTFKRIREQFGPVSLALIPIGAYEPQSFMKPVHLNPDEALEAHNDLDAQASIAIHYGTFRMAADSYADPVNRLNSAVASRPPKNPFHLIPVGSKLELNGAETSAEQGN